MKPQLTWFLGGGLAILILSAAFSTGYLVHALREAGAEAYPLVVEGERFIQAHFLGEIPEPIVLQRGMLKGMVETLGDEHTVFLEPVVHELESDNLAGEYGGIGARLTRDERGRFQIYPFEESPAMQAGIAQASVLLEVDHWVVSAEARLQDVQAALRGPVDTQVQISVQASIDDDPQTYVIERANFPLPAVSDYILDEYPQIGILQITLFSDKVVEEVRAALERLKAHGVSALVLDLRGNSGGLIDRGVDLAGVFLPGETIFVETNRVGDLTCMESEAEPTLWSLPLVVLIDEGTASASETVAAALQYHQRAILIGEPSFGKSSIQLVFELSDGSSLRVTASRWLTPGLRDIEATGLTPDILVQADESTEDLALLRALQLADDSLEETP